MTPETITEKVVAILICAGLGVLALIWGGFWNG